jgi:hypothetical protein
MRFSKHENILTKRFRLSEKELANYWGVTRNTLQKWRSNKCGPAYIKIGAKVIYTREAIIEYEQGRMFRGTGERITPPSQGV